MTASAPPLPPAAASAKPLPRTVAIEAIFVRFAPDECEAEASVWNVVDEQSIDASLRHRLAAHGLRAGVASSPLPGSMRSKLEDAAAGQGEAALKPASEQVVVRRVLRLLPGRESRLVARASLDELVVFESDVDGGGDGVLGRTFRDATSELVLTAWPTAEGRSRLVVVPAIEHGPHRRSWTGEDGVFQLEAGQARHLFESLRIDLELSPERLLVVGGHDVADSSVASALFRNASAGDRRIVILRPLGPTHDPMFDPVFDPVFDDRGTEGPHGDETVRTGVDVPTGDVMTPR